MYWYIFRLARDWLARYRKRSPLPALWFPTIAMAPAKFVWITRPVFYWNLAIYQLWRTVWCVWRANLLSVGGSEKPVKRLFESDSAFNKWLINCIAFIPSCSSGTAANPHNPPPRFKWTKNGNPHLLA